MRFSSSILYLLASTLVAGSCQKSDDGNYYCGSTKKVSYAGVGYSGTYPDITNMDSSSGSCSSKSYSFSGNLSPLDEELSLHFRGPLKLKQFGVYYPKGKNSKREEDCDTTNFHKHHRHKRALKVVEVTETVFVNAEGETQTSQKTSTSTGTAAGDANTDTSAVTTTATTSSSSPSSTFTSSPSSSGETSDEQDDADDDDESSADSWTRAAYYTPGSADGVVFFNHHGGSGSGVWDMSFGNSISYCNSDASGGSSSPVALDDVTIDSNNEYLIMSDNKCDGDSCGYYREGIPAYHGFGGNQKIFVFEFQMPQASGSKTSINYDMPAIWALNAKIPRTLQYGKSECTCWPDCGELDLFEILSSGSSKLISHLHSGQGGNGGRGGGGSQDYFDRPYDSTMKAAVIFDGSDISIVEVDDDFGSSLSKSTVDGWLSESGSKATIGY